MKVEAPYGQRASVPGGRVALSDVIVIDRGDVEGAKGGLNGKGSSGAEPFVDGNPPNVRRCHALL